MLVTQELPTDFVLSRITDQPGEIQRIYFAPTDQEPDVQCSRDYGHAPMQPRVSRPGQFTRSDTKSVRRFQLGREYGNIARHPHALLRDTLAVIPRREHSQICINASLTKPIRRTAF